MRVFAYYLGHTIINTIKKLFRTWVAFFVVVILMAAVVGGVVGVIASTVEKRVSEETKVEDEQDKEDDDALGGFGALFGDAGLEKEEIIELVASGLIVFVVFFSLLNSKGIGEIFQPADAVMLFSAPIRPQSVMIFRLVTALGMQVIMSLFMLFQIPNLVANAGVPLMVALSMFMAWVMLGLITTLLQVLIYILSSYSEKIKRNAKLVIGALLACIGVAFLYNLATGDKNLIAAAAKTLTGSSTYGIPFWGWLRGYVMYALAGDIPKMLLFLGLNIVGIVVLIVVVWNLRVDFYEDALEATEKKAEAIMQAKNNSNATGIVRKKDRSEKIQRDSFNKGSGASVFYYKTIYNRRRLSLFRGITKTMLFYLGACIFIIFMGEIKEFNHTFGVICGVLSVIAFYRTLANPLREDITKEYFMLVPEPAWKKLGWSLLGGSVNTIADMILPYLASVIWLEVNPIDAIVWFLFILSIDLYGTLVGTFIYISIGEKLGEMVEKVVQVAFIYLGILPAMVFVIIGLIINKMMMFLPFGILLNLAMSLLFFYVVPKLMENGR